MPDEFIQASFGFPQATLAGNMEKCLGDCSYNEVCSLRSHLVELYAQLRTTWNSGRAIIARKEFIEDNPRCLVSPSDLSDKISYLQGQDSEHITESPKLFDELMESCHTDKQMRRFYEKGILGSKLLAYAAQFGMAGAWWYMDQIVDGRRIGSIQKIKNRPDLDGFFQEFKNMKDVFPNYDKLVTYMLSKNDAIRNSEASDSADLFLDYFGQFENALKRGDPRGMAAASNMLRGYD